jgi:3-isopropylmalate/(R)-2-methylmalate dehydratase small subunit
MSEPLRLVDGIAAALPTHNVDTDVIMPKRFLRTITRAGLAEGFLADLRAEPGFALNREPWKQARILVVGDNFGCGSSREHAVWGLSQYGIRVLLGTGYAGIFYDNCRNNGVAAITLPAADRDRLQRLAADPATARFAVCLETQRIRYAGGETPFTMPEAIRADLIAGRDAIASTLTRETAIAAFEARMVTPARSRR